MVDDYNNSDRIFSIITDVNEVLSLANESQKLLDMVLDTLVQLLGVDCCWVQLLRPENRRLQLAACRGFTPDMERETGSMDLEHSLAYQVAALGHKISISDLSRNRKYGLSSFSQAGFASLVVVPIMTYRIHGIMGIASSSRKRFAGQVSKLLTVIAGLLGTALSKADLYQRTLAGQGDLSADRLETESVPGNIIIQPEAEVIADGIVDEVSEAREIKSLIPDRDTSSEWAYEEDVMDLGKVVGKIEKIGEANYDILEVSEKTADTFKEHVRSMKAFRRTHTAD